MAHLLRGGAQLATEGCSFLVVLGHGALGSDGLGLQEVTDLQRLERGIHTVAPGSLSALPMVNPEIHSLVCPKTQS